MPSSIQSRLDPETQAQLDELVNRLGMTPSEIVREGIRALARSQPAPTQPPVVGLGKFRSGVRDLATNKKRLKGLGR